MTTYNNNVLDAPGTAQSVLQSPPAGFVLLSGILGLVWPGALGFVAAVWTIWTSQHRLRGSKEHSNAGLLKAARTLAMIGFVLRALGYILAFVGL